MLMYRKVTGSEVPHKFSADMIPAYLKNEIKDETDKLVKE